MTRNHYVSSGQVGFRSGAPNDRNGPDGTGLPASGSGAVLELGAACKGSGGFVSGGGDFKRT